MPPSTDRSEDRRSSRCALTLPGGAVTVPPMGRARSRPRLDGRDPGRRPADGPSRRSGAPLLACTLLGALLLAGCSVRQLAVRTVSKALVGDGANVFASDDDPQLIAEALPFALKTFEALVQQDPENGDLLLTTCSSFTQYSYAFVELEAERLRPVDHRAARAERERAVALYLRARDYCLRALELRAAGTGEGLLRDTEGALEVFDRDDVPLLYWTAGAWGSAISTGRHRTELMVDLDVVRAILTRALELDPTFERGALHDAMVALEALPEAMGGSYERARFHYRRAVELSAGQRAGSHLNWAWLVTIGRQDRADFERALEAALDIDPDEARPSDRLANTVNQDFARFLLSRRDELFLDDEPP